MEPSCPSVRLKHDRAQTAQQMNSKFCTRVYEVKLGIEFEEEKNRASRLEMVGVGTSGKFVWSQNRK